MPKPTPRFKLTARRAFALFVGGPSLAIWLYLFFLAQPVYEAQVKFIIRENKDNAAASVPGLATTLLGLGSQTSLEDAYILGEYLQSPAFLDLADEKLGLRKHFAAPRLDPVHALRKQPLAEEFYEYVRRRILVTIASDSKIVTVGVKAFEPAIARDLAKLIVEESEQAINRLNVRMVASQTSLAERELQKHQEQLLAKRRELLVFQTEHSMINPATQVGSQLTNVALLDARLMEKRTELRAKGQYLREDAFELKTLRQEIGALEAQRLQETGVLVAAEDQSMAATLQAYEKLKMEAEFALQAYTSAFAFVETARLEAARQGKFLLSIQSPRLPEEPVQPRPLKSAVSIFTVAALLFALGRLAVATVRDHSI